MLVLPGQQVLNQVQKRAEDGTRTRDLLITNQLLYQLSYFGKKRTSLFFGMAKVMEIFIWQNFAKIFFDEIAAFFSTAIKTAILRASAGICAGLLSRNQKRIWKQFKGLKSLEGVK